MLHLISGHTAGYSGFLWLGAPGGHKSYCRAGHFSRLREHLSPSIPTASLLMKHIQALPLSPVGALAHWPLFSPATHASSFPVSGLSPYPKLVGGTHLVFWSHWPCVCVVCLPRCQPCLSPSSLSHLRVPQDRDPPQFCYDVTKVRKFPLFQ